MTWRATLPAPSGTHHLHRGEPAYSERFDQVLKFHDPGLAAVRRGEAAWHIHPDGSAAYPGRFLQTFGFYEDLAAVTASDGWHHIGPDGSASYAHRFAWCGNFQEQRCTVRRDDGTYLHINGAGIPAYQGSWRYAGDYRDGCAVVQGDHGQSTHVDLHGGLVHGYWFDDLDVFHKGLARARDEAGWTHVNQAGRAIYERRFASVEPFYNGQARVETFEGGLEVIDPDATPVLHLRGPIGDDRKVDGRWPSL